MDQLPSNQVSTQMPLPKVSAVAVVEPTSAILKTFSVAEEVVVAISRICLRLYSVPLVVEVVDPRQGRICGVAT